MGKKKRLMFACLGCVLALGCAVWSSVMGFSAAGTAVFCGAGACGTGSLALESSGNTKEEICSLKEKLPFGFQREDADVLPEQGQEGAAAASDGEEPFAPVELILQNPELPNGCGVTSLAMVLTAAGFPVSHVELYEGGYLPTGTFHYSGNQRFGPSPEEVYVGDAASSTGGWYCFEGPVLQAGDAWLARSGGCGMDEEICRRAFEKFYQGDTSYASQGNGLGLALAKKIVDIAGGRIRVESAPGEGSAFTVELNTQAQVPQAR